MVAEATRFTHAWTGFAVGRKGWGYAADQRPSTHPVAPESVVDTAHALLNFDGISYAKGAAALRQLAAWLGDDAFLAGLRAHIATHAFGNATLADLLDALAAASGRDLTAWADAWLRTAAGEHAVADRRRGRRRHLRVRPHRTDGPAEPPHAAAAPGRGRRVRPRSPAAEFCHLDPRDGRRTRLCLG